MDHQLVLKTSKEHIARCLIRALIIWVGFNIVTGLLTGDSSLDDNYFILFLLLSYVGFIASYKVKIDRGHITTYQATMVTNNINLFKASEVVEEKDRLVVIYPDDARFAIKHARFNEQDQVKVLELTVPQVGERPKIAPEIIEQHEQKIAKKRKTNFTQNIVGGLSLVVLGVVALFTGTIYIPDRYGFVSLEKEPTYFYVLLTFLLCWGTFSVIYGVIGKVRAKNA